MRPTWDEYFMNIAFCVSLRSDDPDIQHGAVIVDHHNHIVGTGYNATIKGSDPEIVPYSIRDEKRKWMIHAEENAILNCSRESGSRRLYVTGVPCVNCLQRIVNFGIGEVIYARRAGSITENEETARMRDSIIQMSRIVVRPQDNSPLFHRLRETIDSYSE